MLQRVHNGIHNNIGIRIFGCALLTAVSARIAMPLPYTPVPVTWQVAAVLFAGLTLGSRAGFASQLAYLMIGLAGAPVFANGGCGVGYLLNPMGTAGYLLAMPLAAWAVGAVAEKAKERGTAIDVMACLSGIGVIYGMGCIWLSAWLHMPLTSALMAGAGWFMVWDIAKAFAVITFCIRMK